MNAQKAIDEIVELNNALHVKFNYFQNNKDTDNNLKSSLNELLYLQKNLQNNFPKEYAECINDPSKFGFLKPLNVMSDHIFSHYPELIETITEKTDETILNVLKEFQKNSHYMWLKSNITAEIKEKSVTPRDKLVYCDMGTHLLPMVKNEKMGDFLCLAFSGKLSAHVGKINNLKKESEKIEYLEKLMREERKYLKWDFYKETLQDVTVQIHVSINRKLTASQIIDSSYLDEKKETLHCVIGTSDPDTEKQGKQLFEIFHAIKETRKRGELKINGSNNLKTNIMFLTTAFFCTQDESEITSFVSAGRGGGKKEKEGYHHLSKRKTFESFFDKVIEKDEMDKLNGLTVLSIIGNDLSYPRFPNTYEVTDIIHCNPITSGASTLWLYEEFEKIKLYEGKKKNEKFFNFLLDYSNDTLDTLNKMKTGIERNKNSTKKSDNLLELLKDSMERTLQGISVNFSSYNLEDDNGLPRDINEKERKKIQSLIEKTKIFNHRQPNNKMQFAQGALSSMLNGGFLNNGKDIIQSQEENNQYLNNQIQAQINQEKAIKTIDVENDFKKMNQTERLSLVLENILDRHALGKYKELYQKIDMLTKQIYSHGKEHLKKFIISNHLLNAIKVGKIMIDTGDKFTTVIKTPDRYMKEPKEFSTSFYFNFKSGGSQIRTKIKDLLDQMGNSSIVQNIEKAEKFKKADELIVGFIDNFSTEQGIIKIIHDGFDQSLKNLVTDLENLLGNDNQKGIKYKS